MGGLRARPPLSGVGFEAFRVSGRVRQRTSDARLPACGLAPGLLRARPTELRPYVQGRGQRESGPVRLAERPRRARPAHDRPRKCAGDSARFRLRKPGSTCSVLWRFSHIGGVRSFRNADAGGLLGLGQRRSVPARRA
jgi:hypothetical protein